LAVANYFFELEMTYSLLSGTYLLTFVKSILHNLHNIIG